MLNIISVTKDDLPGITKTVGSTLRLRRTGKVKQLVIDGSDPLTAAKVQKNTSSQQGVSYFHLPPSGISAAFNFGLTKITQPWVWFLNGGDQLHPKVDAGLFLSILDSTSADIVIFELESDSGISARPPFPHLWPPLANWVPHPATVIRTSLLEKVGEFDPVFKIAMDGDYWLRSFPQAKKVDLISIPLTRFAPGGLSSDGYKTAREAKKMIEKHAFSLIRTWLKNGLLQLKVYYEYSRSKPSR